MWCSSSDLVFFKLSLREDEVVVSHQIRIRWEEQWHCTESELHCSLMWQKIKCLSHENDVSYSYISPNWHSFIVF